jgi:hypothetical protein
MLLVEKYNVYVIVFEPNEVGSGSEFKCPVRISIRTLDYID